MATPTCRNWFAGDLTGVYSAMGFKAPIDPPTYTRLLPNDCRGFTMRVFLDLGGNAVKHERLVMSQEEGHERQAQNHRNNVLATLADESLGWVELAEGLGRPPDLTEFGARSSSTTRSSSTQTSTPHGGRRRTRLRALSPTRRLRPWLRLRARAPMWWQWRRARRPCFRAPRMMSHLALLATAIRRPWQKRSRRRTVTRPVQARIVARCSTGFDINSRPVTRPPTVDEAPQHGQRRPTLRRQVAILHAVGSASQSAISGAETAARPRSSVSPTDPSDR